MKKAFTLTIFLTLAINLFAQLDTIIRYPLQDSTSSNIASLILNTSGGELLYFTKEADSIYLSRSTDQGVNWVDRRSLFPGNISVDNDMSGLVTDQGKIIITYRKEYSISNNFRYSEDNGHTWSEPVLAAPGIIKEPSLKQTPDGRLWLIFTYSGTLKYRLSENEGDSWGVPKNLWLFSNGGDLISIDDTTLFLAGVLKHEFRDDYDLYGRFSYDSGLNWGEPFEIVSSELDDLRPRLVRKSDGEIELVYCTSKLNATFPEFYSKILTTKSNDNGMTWLEPSYFASYLGYNGDHNICLADDKTFITFSSDKFNSRQIWYGISDISEDSITPPFLYLLRIAPSGPFPEEPITFSIYAEDDNGIEEVKLFHSVNGVEQEPKLMYDDGEHNDGSENDDLFGCITQGYLPSDTVIYYATATDITSYTTVSNPDTFIFSPTINLEAGLIDVNNVYLPVANNGTIGDARVMFPDNTMKQGGWFDEYTFLYSGGFGLSGYTNGSLWANAMMTASRIADYIPGSVNSSNDSLESNLYLLKSTTAPFSASWIEWKKAVELGADFYDADSDGIYNPVDINGNGEWDANEDAPDLLGDITIWCVYNDGLPANSRAFEDVHPQGIDIRQSVFAYNKTYYPELANVVFIRYKIENTGSMVQTLDSVYFSAWADADLGNALNDLNGSDTTIQSGYCYNNGEDAFYGPNPPAFFITLLEGPATYAAGTSYSDNNTNGVYDEGIDTPLDTAKISNGNIIGLKELPGAMNLPMKAFISYLKYQEQYDDPETKEELHNYMQGKFPEDQYLDPCSWQYGTVINEDCAGIDPVFMYSGDPVSRRGWIDTSQTDIRMTSSTGPFQLEVDKPIEILVAYTVGRGTDPLNSITVGKEIVKDVIRFYDTNFSDYSVGINNNRQVHVPTEFSLSQNYPNPFNPATTIEYSLPADSELAFSESDSKNNSEKSPLLGELVPRNLREDERGGLMNVQLKVYDVLGREVATLVDKPQAPGNYNVHFDASALATGVYFYSLKYGLFSQSKKMIVIK